MDKFDNAIYENSIGTDHRMLHLSKSRNGPLTLELDINNETSIETITLLDQQEVENLHFILGRLLRVIETTPETF